MKLSNLAFQRRARSCLANKRVLYLSSFITQNPPIVNNDLPIKEYQDKFTKLIKDLKSKDIGRIEIPYALLEEFENWVRENQLPVNINQESRWYKTYAPGDLIPYSVEITKGETTITVWK
jgi:hypothetical protein